MFELAIERNSIRSSFSEGMGNDLIALAIFLSVGLMSVDAVFSFLGRFSSIELMV